MTTPRHALELQAFARDGASVFRCRFCERIGPREWFRSDCPKAGEKRATRDLFRTPSSKIPLTDLYDFTFDFSEDGRRFTLNVNGSSRHWPILAAALAGFEVTAEEIRKTAGE